MKEIDREWVKESLADCGNADLDILVTSDKKLFDILNDLARDNGKSGSGFAIKEEGPDWIKFWFPLDIMDHISFGWYHMRVEKELYLKRGKNE